MTALLADQEFAIPMFPEDIVDRLVDRTRRIATLEAERIALVADLIDGAVHESLAYRSVTALLIDRLGVPAGVAAGMVHLARTLADMPHTRRALARGDLDLARVRRLTAAREVNPRLFAEHERTLVDTVSGLGAADTAQALAHWSQQAAPEQIEDRAALIRDRRRLHVSLVGDMVHLDGRLDPVSGQIVITALDALTDPGNLDPDDTRRPAQRRADALVGMCRDTLDRTDLPSRRGERPHLLVHVSLDALEGRAGRPCETDDTGVLTPETVRRLACDARITRVITGPDSQILDIGRTTRVIPRGIRLALIARDGGCVIPGCRAPHRWCDAHHVIHWADGGPTNLRNLALVCDRHHTLIHEGKIRLPARV